MRCDVLDGELSFNGDDALLLWQESEENGVDMFGDIQGPGPGAAWTIAGVRDATRDRTAVRLPFVTTGSLDWPASAANEWEVLDRDSLVLADGTELIVSETAGNGVGTDGAQSGFVLGTSDYLGGIGSDGQRAGCVAPGSDRGDRRPDRSRLRIATLNAEWLFDGVRDPSASPWSGDPASAQRHLEDIAQVVDRMEADIVNLVEVEDCSRLEALIQEMLPMGGGEAGRKLMQQSPGSPYRGYLRTGRDTATGQNVALLTKVDPSQEVRRTDERAAHPIVGSRCGFDGRMDDTGVSKNYYALFDDIEGLGFPLAVVGTHLKAFPTDERSCSQREAQAAVLQQLLRQLHDQGYELVLLGDLNDFSDTTPDIAFSQPTSQVLEMLRDFDGDGQDDMVNVAARVDQNSRFTSWFDRNGNGEYDTMSRERSSIDHVLVSSRVFELVDGVIIDQGYDPTRISDHWPVIVDLALSPTSTAANVEATTNPAPEENSAAAPSVAALLPMLLPGLLTILLYSLLT